MELKRVVVTGLGALTPIGNTITNYWQSLLNGVSGADYIQQFDASAFRTHFACELKNFDPLNYLDRKEARKLDRFAQYALVASDEAIKEARLADPNIDRHDIGVIWSSGIGGIFTFQEQMRDYLQRGKRPPRFSPHFITKMILDIAAGHISIRHDFRNLNYAVVSACASSTHALIDAFTHLRLGRAKVVVTGGSEAPITECGLGGFSSMRALSKRNDDPKTASRPFDLNRDGFVLGEGAACLVLEELEHALRRNAPIYAEVVGGGMTADAHHVSAPHPKGRGARKVMEQALNDAQLSHQTVDYINVHGTSTSLGDVAETKAIMEVFGEHAFALNISSTKSMTGHLLGAAGAVEAVATVLSIKNNIVPPTINHFTDDPAFDERLNFTFNKAQQRPIRAALSNTFGFGGHNASVLFKKFEG